MFSLFVEGCSVNNNGHNPKFCLLSITGASASGGIIPPNPWTVRLRKTEKRAGGFLRERSRAGAHATDKAVAPGCAPEPRSWISSCLSMSADRLLGLSSNDSLSCMAPVSHLTPKKGGDNLLHACGRSVCSPEPSSNFVSPRQSPMFLAPFCYIQAV